jgi:phage shock protein C
MKGRSDGTRRRLYRSRSGLLLGVCKGIADYLDISVFWTRIIVLALLFFTKFLPIVGLYILAALLIKREPYTHLDVDLEGSRSMTLQRLRRALDNLERRIRRMEDTATTKEHDWERRFNT